MSTSKVRLQGLVKSAGWARDRLATGILPQEAAGFRQRVRAAVAQTEAICAAHHIQPADLPTPSYRAYCFLRDIPLDALPTPREATPQRPPTVRITNILAIQNAMNAAFAAWVSKPKHRSQTLNAKHPEVQHFAQKLRAHVEQIETLARKQGGTPGHLPTRSLRAYQWLKFLSDAPTLTEHLKTLRVVLHEFQRLPGPTRGAPHPPIQVEFTYGSHLYRAVKGATGLRVTLHEGFLGAPLEVLRAVVYAVTSKQHEQERQILREYSASDDFAEVVYGLEMTTTITVDYPQGRTYDLETIFNRVNRAYFGGKMARPKLMWNRILTTSHMGHYDSLRDVVMISMTLDAPEVPEYVVDYVMYHELLHKQFGVSSVNGRRKVHTPEFRAAERKYHRYAEAHAFIHARSSSP